MTRAKARTHLAWLMYCFMEGYHTAEDRKFMTNWLLDDPETLTPHDRVLREHLLETADEILAALQAEAT